MIRKYEVQIQCKTCKGMYKTTLDAEEFQTFIEYQEDEVSFYCASCAVLEIKDMKKRVGKMKPSVYSVPQMERRVK